MLSLRTCTSGWFMAIILFAGKHELSFSLLQVKSRKHQSPKEALKYKKSWISLSFPTHPLLQCCFEISWFWHGFAQCKPMRLWVFYLWGMGGMGRGCFFSLFSFVLFAFVLLLSFFFVFSGFSWVLLFSLPYWCLGLSEVTDNKIPHTSHAVDMWPLFSEARILTSVRGPIFFLTVLLQMQACWSHFFCPLQKDNLEFL